MILTLFLLALSHSVAVCVQRSLNSALQLNTLLLLFSLVLLYLFHLPLTRHMQHTHTFTLTQLSDAIMKLSQRINCPCYVFVSFVNWVLAANKALSTNSTHAHILDIFANILLFFTQIHFMINAFFLSSFHNIHITM